MLISTAYSTIQIPYHIVWFSALTQIAESLVSPGVDYMEMCTGEERVDLSGSAEVAAVLLHTTQLGVEERLVTHIEREMHFFFRETFWP